MVSAACPVLGASETPQKKTHNQESTRFQGGLERNWGRQHWAGALSLLCCSSCSRASRAPSTLPDTAWLEYEVWDPLLGHEATSFVKTQHHTSFTCVECLDLFSWSVLIKVLSDIQCHHISECFHLWASCTFQRSPSASKLQYETYTVYALCHLGLGKLL